jgi:hypothetical protein
MNKLTNVSNARIVSHNPGDRATEAGAALAANNHRKIDPAWIEFADHLMLDKLPFVAIALELGRGLKEGRVPLRAVLLLAALAI